MSAGSKILAGDARAWGRVADHVRRAGGLYLDAFGVIVDIFVDAGREPPSLADFEAKMYEADALEGGEGR